MIIFSSQNQKKKLATTVLDKIKLIGEKMNESDIRSVLDPVFSEYINEMIEEVKKERETLKTLVQNINVLLNKLKRNSSIKLTEKENQVLENFKRVVNNFKFYPTSYIFNEIQESFKILKKSFNDNKNITADLVLPIKTFERSQKNKNKFFTSLKLTHTKDQRENHINFLSYLIYSTSFSESLDFVFPEGIFEIFEARMEQEPEITKSEIHYFCNKNPLAVSFLLECSSKKKEMLEKYIQNEDLQKISEKILEKTLQTLGLSVAEIKNIKSIIVNNNYSIITYGVLSSITNGMKVKDLNLQNANTIAILLESVKQTLGYKEKVSSKDYQSIPSSLDTSFVEEQTPAFNSGRTGRRTQEKRGTRTTYNSPRRLSVISMIPNELSKLSEFSEVGEIFDPSSKEEQNNNSKFEQLNPELNQETQDYNIDLSNLLEQKRSELQNNWKEDGDAQTTFHSSLKTHNSVGNVLENNNNIGVENANITQNTEEENNQESDEEAEITSKENQIEVKELQPIEEKQQQEIASLLCVLLAFTTVLLPKEEDQHQFNMPQEVQ